LRICTWSWKKNKRPWYEVLTRPLSETNLISDRRELG
jgi:hypothetical protein